MDMLAGWTDMLERLSEGYTDVCDTTPLSDYAAEFDKVASLYQDSGLLEDPEDIERFVLDRVLPLILNGARS
jgi:hypothetical protein